MNERNNTCFPAKTGVIQAAMRNRPDKCEPGPSGRRLPTKSMKGVELFAFFSKPRSNWVPRWALTTAWGIVLTSWMTSWKRIGQGLNIASWILLIVSTDWDWDVQISMTFPEDLPTHTKA